MSSFAELEQCVQQNISSPNNNERKQAECNLNELRQKSPEQFFHGMSQLMCKSSIPSIRSFACVLLRQSLYVLDSHFDKISKSNQKNLGIAILQQMSIESDSNVLRQLCELVGALAVKKLQTEQWPELMQVMIKLAKSEIVRHRKAFCMMSDKLAEFSIDFLRNHLQNIQQLLALTMQDNDQSVRTSALKCIVSIIVNLDENEDIQQLKNILPLLFQNINPGMDAAVICQSCEYLQILTDNRPQYFRNSMQPILACLSQVISCQELYWDCKRLSMNLLLTLLEYHSIIDIIDVQLIAKEVIPLVFLFLNDFQLNEEMEDQENFIFGGECIARIVPIIGGQLFLSCVQSIFDKGFSNNGGDVHRLVALSVIENACESCANLWMENLNPFVIACCESLQHSQSFIRIAALRVINKLCLTFSDIGNGFVTKYDESIVPALVHMLDGNENEVMIQVCDTIAHYIYNDEECEITLKYASKLLENLYKILNRNDCKLRCSAFKAVSVVISIMNEHFIEFYDTFMKLCQNLLQLTFNDSSNDCNGILRGKCMECMAQMISVAPVEKCKSDAHSIMKVLLPLLTKNKNNESYAYMIRLFATVAECLKHEFQPYLQLSIEPLLDASKIQSVKIRSAAVSEPQNTPLLNMLYQQNKNNNNSSGMDDDRKDVFTQSFAGIEFSVNTAEIFEKTLAVRTFVRYCCALEGTFLPYVKPVCEVLLPMLGQRVQSDLRQSAVETMAPLVHCLQTGLQQNNYSVNDINQIVHGLLLDKIFPAFVDAMGTVDAVDDLSAICVSIIELIAYLPKEMSTSIRALIGKISEQLQNAMQERRIRRELETANTVNDDEEIADMAEADLADTIVDVIAALVKKFGENYVDIFHEYCHEICCGQLLDEHSTDGDNILALSMLTEIIQYGGSNGQKYVSFVLQKCAQFIQKLNGHGNISNNSSVDCGLIQSACYAIGICGQKKCLVNDSLEWLRLLRTVVDRNDSRSEVNITATENAVSAIAKICNSGNMDMNIVLGWIKMLPITSDDDERDFCNLYLLNIMENVGLENILKTDGMPSKIIEVIAVSIVNDDKQKMQFQQLFQNICSSLDQNLIQRCIQNLPKNLQNAFQS